MFKIYFFIKIDLNYNILKPIYLSKEGKGSIKKDIVCIYIKMLKDFLFLWNVYISVKKDQ